VGLVFELLVLAAEELPAVELVAADGLFFFVLSVNESLPSLVYVGVALVFLTFTGFGVLELAIEELAGTEPAPVSAAVGAMEG
jgi:hypothetical protein